MPTRNISNRSQPSAAGTHQHSCHNKVVKSKKRKIATGKKRLTPYKKRKIATSNISKAKHLDALIVLILFSILENIGFFYIFPGSKEYLISEPLIWGGNERKTKDIQKGMMELWNSFNKPDSVYILIYPNPGHGHGQHAALVLGSTQNESVENAKNYVSWTYEDGYPIYCKRAKASFKKEYSNHGEPEIIEIKGLNIKKIKRKWEQFKKESKHYKLFTRNCTHVALSVLGEGIKNPKLSKAIQKKQKCWLLTPRDMRKQAYYLKKHRKKINTSLAIKNIHGRKQTIAISKPLAIRKLAMDI